MNEEKKKKKKKKKRQKIMIKFFIHIVPLRSKASTRKYKGYLCLFKRVLFDNCDRFDYLSITKRNIAVVLPFPLPRSAFYCFEFNTLLLRRWSLI
jgi:hypothetical protein